MIETKTEQSTLVEIQEQEPAVQRLFDRPFLLLAAGMTVMLVFYTIWGLIEVMTLPTAPLP